MNGKTLVRAALALCLFALAALPAAPAGENLAGLAKPGRLVVGLDDTFAPMGFRDPAGTLVGFDIDLARAVGREMGVEIVFQPIEWSAKEMELATKNIDCIWNGMSRTAEREENMTLSRDYLNNRIIVMTVPGVELASLDDLPKYQVGTQAASAGLDVIKKHPVYEKLGANLHEYSTYDECILDMQAGRLQAMVVDEVLGNYKNNVLGGAFKVATPNFGNDFYAIGFRRDKNDNRANEELVNALEAALDRVVANGEGEEISKKWFGADLLLNTNK